MPALARPPLKPTLGPLLAALALFLLALVPRGWMPAAQGGPMVLCTAAGVQIALPGDDAPEAPGPMGVGDCLFALAGAPVTFPALAVLVAPIRLPILSVAGSAGAPPGWLKPTAPPPPSHAPPAAV
jgi:hypothetical protein